MPKQLFVTKLLRVESFSFVVPLDAKTVNHLKTISTTPVFDVLLNHFILFTAILDSAHLAIESVKIYVYRIWL